MRTAVLSTKKLINESNHSAMSYVPSLNTGIATLLDPRFKKDGFLSEFNVTEAEKILENQLFEINSLSEPHPSSSSCSAEIGQGLGRFLSCGARKQEQT